MLHGRVYLIDISRRKEVIDIFFTEPVKYGSDAHVKLSTAPDVVPCKLFQNESWFHAERVEMAWNVCWLKLAHRGRPETRSVRTKACLYIGLETSSLC